MPYNLSAEVVYAQCPCCDKKVYSQQAIDSEFGFRVMENKERIPQSYCKDCRSAHCESGLPCKAKK